MERNELIKALESMLTEKIPYGYLVGAEAPYAHSGPLVYEDPESYFIEQAIGDVKELSQIKDILGDDYDLDRLRELVQADREGRCVVLSEPMYPMVQIPGDTDVYCPNCAQSLSGGWSLSDAGDYKKMCQCPNCGQSIDDTKREFSEEVLKGEKHG